MVLAVRITEGSIDTGVLGWGQLLFSIKNKITITALHNFSITIIITITIIRFF